MNQIVCVVFFIAISSAYLDIPLEVERKGEMVAYKVPIQIDTIPYSLAISAQNKE